MNLRRFGHFILVLFQILPLPAGASTTRALDWSGVDTNDLKELTLRNYTATTHLRSSPSDPQFAELLDAILQNKDNRISPRFPISDTLEPSVNFWLRVFTQWHSRQVILVDEFHMDWVYAVLDLSQLRAKQGRELVARTIAQHQRAMRRLSEVRSADNLSPLERQLWGVWGKPQLPVSRLHGHRVRQLADQIRVQRGARDALIRALAISEPYLPKMEAIFLEQGLPPELTRLSLLESAFQFDAVSKVGARGLWQFMDRTAHEYLLLSTKAAIDERLSPWKSTVAASALLRGNHKRLGNWFSAITAYNHGFRGIAREKNSESAVKKLVVSACRGKSPLGWASRNYYAEFLAVLYTEAFHLELFGDKPTMDLRPVSFAALPKAISARELALSLGLSLPELLKLNPDVETTQSRLPKGYFVAVPAAQDDFRTLLMRSQESLLKRADNTDHIRRVKAQL